MRDCRGERRAVLREREREIRMQMESQKGEYVGAIIRLAVISQPNQTYPSNRPMGLEY